MEQTLQWSSRSSSDTVSCTVTYHTWQFIIFTIFTITACIFSYSLSLSFLAFRQIISSIFLSYWTDSTDSDDILEGTISQGPGGRISHFPIDFCMVLTTVQRCCASCDINCVTSQRLGGCGSVSTMECGTSSGSNCGVPHTWWLVWCWREERRGLDSKQKERLCQRASERDSRQLSHGPRQSCSTTRHTLYLRRTHKPQPQLPYHTDTTGGLKKVSCWHSTTAYFFEPPCIFTLATN